MLELASPDPQRLLTLPLKVIVVRHQVDVRHRDVVLLGDLAGGKPGEAADRQLWLGREGWVKKGGLSLWGGGSGGLLPRGGAGRAVASPSHLLALKLAKEELTSNASN